MLAIEVKLMARTNEAQLNIRSAYARERSTQLARATGMTATQVIEEALRAYSPPPTSAPRGRLVRRGPLLVMTGGKPVTLEETNAAIEAARTERR